MKQKYIVLAVVLLVIAAIVIAIIIINNKNTDLKSKCCNQCIASITSVQGWASDPYLESCKDKASGECADYFSQNNLTGYDCK